MLNISAVAYTRRLVTHDTYARARTIYITVPQPSPRLRANVLLLYVRSTPSARSSCTRLILRTYTYSKKKKKNYALSTDYYTLLHRQQQQQQQHQLNDVSRVGPTKGLIRTRARTRASISIYTRMLYISFNKFPSFGFSIDGLYNIYT